LLSQERGGEEEEGAGQQSGGIVGLIGGGVGHSGRSGRWRSHTRGEGGVSVEVSAYGEPIAIHELRQGFEVRGIRGRGGVALGVLGIAVDSVREGRIEVSTPGVST